MESVPPPVPQSLTQRDESRLRLLSVFHYVCAGLLLVFGSVPVIHVFLGIMMVTQSGPFNPDVVREFQPRPTPEDVLFGREPGAEDPSHPGITNEVIRSTGIIFIAAGAGIIALSWSFAILAAAAGRSLKKRKRHTFCTVVAGLSCLAVPVGTVLGVFTILVLRRPSVRMAFGVDAGAGAGGGTSGAG